MIARRCLVEPIDEIFVTADLMQRAADAHLEADFSAAERLFQLADDPAVWAFTDAAWGAGAKKRHSFITVANAPPYLSRDLRPQPRMPTPSTMRVVVERDGYHCRFCGMPVVSSKIRKLAHAAYPVAVPWGSTNSSQHAGFQCMWLQFDHILPNSRGGTSEAENVVVTCAPCNFGRMEATLAEAQLMHPLAADNHRLWSGANRWNGLERLRR